MSRRPLPRTPKKLDPIAGSDARDEQTMGMIVALLSEVTVLRARLDTCERLLVAENVLRPDSIDTFTADDDARAEREAMRASTIAKVLRPMRELAERELAAITEATPRETAR